MLATKLVHVLPAESHAQSESKRTAVSPAMLLLTSWHQRDLTSWCQRGAEGARQSSHSLGMTWMEAIDPCEINVILHRQDPCLGWPDFPWASVIATAAALLTNAIEFAAGQYFGAGDDAQPPLLGCGHANGHCSHGATEPLLPVSEGSDHAAGAAAAAVDS